MNAIDLNPGMVSAFGDTTEVIISIVKIDFDNTADYAFDIGVQLCMITYLSTRGGIRYLKVNDNVKFWSFTDLVYKA